MRNSLVDIQLDEKVADALLPFAPIGSSVGAFVSRSNYQTLWL
jgi:hypothetical protein